MDRFISIVDRISGLSLGAVALLTFMEAALRYVLGLQIPDWYSLACLLQGIAIFWGISSTTYEGKHIAVDALWEIGGPAFRRALDIIADVITVLFLGTFAVMLAYKIDSTYDSHQVSPDLGMPLWPFHLVAGLGIASSVALGSIRLWRTATKVY